MSKHFDLTRLETLIKDSIKVMDLDLSGLNVLTEAASGNFVSTCLIAAMANANKVIAVTKDSSYGSANQVIDFCQNNANSLSINNIEFTDQPPHEVAKGINIVTNLGFVRPINKQLIDELPSNAVISLMWEPWELREEDIDVNYCVSKDIPVIGTNERDTRLNTYKSVSYTHLTLPTKRIV